jgi:hypothetical protein
MEQEEVIRFDGLSEHLTELQQCIHCKSSLNGIIPFLNDHGPLILYLILLSFLLSFFLSLKVTNWYKFEVGPVAGTVCFVICGP